MEKKASEKIVIDCTESLLEDFGIAHTSPLSVQTKLFGSEGLLDSMGLVALISDIESAVADERGVRIVLASEKAMSQRNSPFATIGSLALYMDGLISES